jgi:hypothetical protein
MLLLYSIKKKCFLSLPSGKVHCYCYYAKFM